MTLEQLKTELAHAEDSEARSEDQLRQLGALIDKASAPNPDINASDCARLIAAALSLNERLRDRASKLRMAVDRFSRANPSST